MTDIANPALCEAWAIEWLARFEEDEAREREQYYFWLGADAPPIERLKHG